MVQGYLINPGNYTQEQLDNNSKDAFDSVDAAAVAASAAAANASDTERYVNEYFEETGENRQDYIDAIEASK